MRNVFSLVAALLITILSFDLHAGPMEDAVDAIDQNDYRKALRFLIPEANKGSLLAQMMVGSILYVGRGVPKDEAGGVLYLDMCATNSNQNENQSKANCLKLLSNAYAGGHGVSVDNEKAAQYLWASAHYGNEEANGEVIEMTCKGKGKACPAFVHGRIAKCTEICLKK